MQRRCLDTLALRALMKATHLLGLALAERLRQYRDSGDNTLERFAELEEQVLHVAYLREVVDIHGSRWDKLPERQRPHYTPEARFRILRLRRLLALSSLETARLFRISSGTVLRWEQETTTDPARPTIGSLLKPVPPVRRYADVVRHLVQTMTLTGFPGDRSVVLHLGRVGWKLSRRTVQRIRREKPTSPPPPSASDGLPRAVRACYPNHVWMLDLTEIPGFLRLFSFKVAVVLDVFSRAPVAAQVFLQEPTGRDVSRLLIRAVRRFGAPRHCVSDQGAQFKSERFQTTLARLNISHRYGAIGRTGSIAIIERFFRTAKGLGGFRLCPPLLRRDLERRLAAVFLYYLWLRPHQGFAGATPAETWLGSQTRRLASPPPRGRPGERLAVDPDIEIRHLDPERRLPYVVRKAA
jgi:transposase InsO family protein